MIDPQAKPRAYIKLMGLVILLGMISALATFAFITLVHQGTYLLWQEASQALGIDAREAEFFPTDEREAAWEWLNT